MRNRVERRVLLLHKFAGSRIGQMLGRALARDTGITGQFDWKVTDGSWFGNEIVSLELEGRRAHFQISRPVETHAGDTTLEEVGSKRLSQG